MTLTYRLVSYSVLMLGRLFFRLRSEGLDNRPRSGGLLVVANHSSYLDPPLIGAAALPRDFHYFARANLFKIPLLGCLIRRMQAIPVSRGEGDRAALRRAADLLRGGAALLIFPEGTRSADGKLGEGKPGAGLLALQAGVRVIPVHVAGSFEAFPRGARFPRFRRVTLRWGEAKTPEEWLAGRGDAEKPARALVRALMEEIARLGGHGTASHQ